jgi:hypothetical protein
MLRDREMSTFVVRCHYHINKFVIQENEDEIRGNITASAPSNANISCLSVHDPFLDKLERAFSVWFEDGDGGCHGTIQGI